MIKFYKGYLNGHFLKIINIIKVLFPLLNSISLFKKLEKNLQDPKNSLCIINFKLKKI